MLFTARLPPGPLPPALAQALTNISDYATAGLNSTNLPGVSLTIARGSRVLLSTGAGLANTSSGVPMTDRTLTRIGSVSKLFAVVLLYQLVALGRVSLDTPVATLLPSFSVKNPFDAPGIGGAGITLRHLASHRSGLQREAPPFAQSTADVLAGLVDTYLVQPPGGGVPSYSNLGVSLLGHVLGEVVDTSCGYTDCFPSLVEAHILGPLNMVDTGFNYTPSVLSRLAVGYTATGVPAPFAEFGWIYPAGGMYSTTSDLVSLANALLSAATGEVTPLQLPAAVARELLSPSFWNSDGLTLWGTPWEVSVAASSHVLVLNKGGNLGGYSTLIALVPDAGVTLSAAWNGGADEETWSDVALGSILLPGLAAALAPLSPNPPADPGPSPSTLLGSYENVLTGGVVTILMYDSMLLMRIADGINLGVFLAYFPLGTSAGTVMYTMFIPNTSIACQYGQMLAASGTYVSFALNAEGNVTTIRAPGLFPGYTWTPVSGSSSDA